jgi:hypothetical protein
MFTCVKFFVLTQILPQFLCSFATISITVSKPIMNFFLYIQNIDEGTFPGYETVSWTEISTLNCHLTEVLRFPLKIKGLN